MPHINDRVRIPRTVESLYGTIIETDLPNPFMTEDHDIDVEFKYVIKLDKPIPVTSADGIYLTDTIALLPSRFQVIGSLCQ